MLKLNREYLENFITLLEKADSGGTADVPEEPLTLHRRGHWFKSSIAHHISSSHNVFQLIEYYH